MKPTKLAVFDFDSTLFRSPLPPEGYKGNWWITKDSLSGTNVPEKPNDSFWNMQVVKAAREYAAKPEVYSIMLTGRVDKFFRERIEGLLKQKDLKFKEIGLNDFGRDSAEFKIEQIDNILINNPTITSIEMWEDDLENAEIYKATYPSAKINVVDASGHYPGSGKRIIVRINRK